MPEVGQMVVVRSRAFVVADKIADAPHQGALGSLASSLVRLSSVEDDALGEELEVIWELEPGAFVLEDASLPDPKGFDDPRTLDAFMHAVRWGAVSPVDQKALQSPFRSGIDIEDYQLDPVVRALTMPRVSLLVADDVGLGKTIEAGLVIQEMILRHRVRTVLVVCPSSLQVQWQEEMRDKFGLEFRIIDSDSISELRRKRGIHVNPWSHFPRLITSIDFFKRERVLRSFRETLPAGDAPSYPRTYDLLIVDEAHNIAPSGTGKYAKESQRTQAIRAITPHFEHKMFMSATPHNGYRESFSALLELLDNQRFARAVEPDRKQLEAVMVRRLKQELKERWDGSSRFAERHVQHLEVPYTALEREAHKALTRYSQLRVKSAHSAEQRVAAEFVLKLLKKRLFSSPAAFARTLEKHLQNLAKRLHTNVSKVLLKQQFDAVSEDFGNDEDYETATDEAMGLASGALQELSAEERTLLGQLQEYAERSASGADSKAAALLAWLDEHIRPQGQWGNERVIIFTEYRDTQKWLHDLLARQGFAQDERLLMIYGGMPQDERERIKAAFQAKPEDAKVRILLATDAASEGVNLQNHCSKLIHYEIPWNPNRMEQRNGRVDRHGQKAARVDVYHFVGQGFGDTKPGTRKDQLEDDLEFLMRAALKVETIRQDLGKVGPVIAQQVEEAMLGRRTRLETDAVERDAEPARRMLKFERDLRKQLEALHDQLHETKRDLGVEPENIEHVVRTGLALAGQPPLIPTGTPGVFRVPILTGSWARGAEGLPHPHTKAVRPIVFDPNLAQGRDDVVLAHLNHRLVQMCLRLLRAEIWSAGGEKKLYRVTSKLVPDTALQTPAIIVHGRIVVLGEDNHRLHEEIIMAGGLLREGRFARMNVGDTARAYGAASSEPAPEALREKLAELWPNHKGSALAALEARMAERTKNLESFLNDRAEQEVGRFTVVMQELEAAIRAELKESTVVQPTLFDFDEKQQWERDRSALRRRLEEIPQELERELAHLRARYRNPHAKLFPLSVTYLVPQKLAAAHRGGRA